MATNLVKSSGVPTTFNAASVTAYNPLQQVVEAVKVLVDNAQLHVDMERPNIGGIREVDLNSIVGSLSFIHGLVLPYLNERNGVLSFRENTDSSDQFWANHFKEKVLPALREHYSDFPEIIGALETIASIAEDPIGWKTFIRAQSTPTEVASLRPYFFQNNLKPRIELKHSSTLDSKPAALIQDHS